MATKIKAIKCPQCGSEKHEQLDDKRYKCKSCGTEFYIDDDDININVNHRYEYQSPNSSSLNSFLSTGIKIGIIALLAPIAIVVILFYSAMHSGSSSSPSFSGTTRDSVEIRDDYRLFLMSTYNGKPCYFYVLERDYASNYGDENPKYVDGYYCGFRDATTGNVLKEQLLISEKDTRERNSMSPSDMVGRYFHQARKWFFIISDKFIYELNPKTLTFKDVSKLLFKGKEVMNTGISSVNFINIDSGEGFEVHNNLSATYYYFPATNRLYTEKAFNYACTLSPDQLNGEVRDTTFFKLRSKNISESSSKGGYLCLWKIHALFHNGDPQDFSFYNSISGSYTPSSGNRLISAQPVTDWFVGFDGQIKYYDANYILITFKPTIADDAKSVFQLRNAYGNILWTQAVERFTYISEAVVCNNRFWIYGRREGQEGKNEENIYSFDLKDGKCTTFNSIHTEYKIKAK